VDGHVGICSLHLFAYLFDSVIQWCGNDLSRFCVVVKVLCCGSRECSVSASLLWERGMLWRIMSASMPASGSGFMPLRPTLRIYAVTRWETLRSTHIRIPEHPHKADLPNYPTLTLILPKPDPVLTLTRLDPLCGCSGILMWVLLNASLTRCPRALIDRPLAFHREPCSTN